MNKPEIKANSKNKVLVSSKTGKLKPLFFYIILVFIFLCAPHSLSAQNDREKEADTIQQDKNKQQDSLVKKHSPRKAGLYSAALPGLGQAYNEKYWKIPIIYAGFGTLAYFINQNNTEYNKFKKAYAYVIAGEEGEPPNEYVIRYESNKDNLRKLKDYYRRNLELTYILTGALYILNIIDATVDAHFFEFNVDKDLSLKVSPYIHTNIQNPALASKGISISLNL
ncbi:MAG: hypothetical protein K9J27_08065 [Bacteroidales bacterium]|nr:hypothetical protein [Bacteroidales bacterium]MCF8333430.1 hypothetical protein [Bacteroidales bacterium]